MQRGLDFMKQGVYLLFASMNKFGNRSIVPCVLSIVLNLSQHHLYTHSKSLHEQQTIRPLMFTRNLHDKNTIYKQFYFVYRQYFNR